MPNRNALLTAWIQRPGQQLRFQFGYQRWEYRIKSLSGLRGKGADNIGSVAQKMQMRSHLNQSGPYPRGGKPAVVAANLLNRQFNPETLNTWWSGDITYLRTAQGWLYLAIVMDLCSRKIVSWAFSDKPDSDLTVRALRLAVNKRRPTGSVVFHSDQGAQYTSAQFQSCQQELDVTGSMSRKGNCLDNAVTERFFRSLKAERVNYRRYETRSQGIADVIDYIDSFYNLKRRHYRLGNISPDEYERRLQQCA